MQILAQSITELEVDAIVNSANKYLIAGGGVCGAIHKAAGKELEVECKALGGCEVGEAKITAAYDLPCDYVIHAVGPIWYDGARNEPELLAATYRSCMALANHHKIKSIAFPVISVGVHRFPLDLACEIALSEVADALAHETSVEKVYFCCVDAKVKLSLERSRESLVV
jgi:O-acetyl-ADP-ribose deacetylase (regulator of RNase III)